MSGDSFSFGPKVTVTEIGGGEGFSQVPDRASCSLDMRLTPESAGFGYRGHTKFR